MGELRMKRLYLCFMACFILGACSSERTTYGPEQIGIVAEGIRDNRAIELTFTVKDENGWNCPGVNVHRKPGGRIDLEFLRVKDEKSDAIECDISVERTTGNPELLKLRVPHDWQEENEAEIYLDGTKPLGKWSWTEQEIESTTAQDAE